MTNNTSRVSQVRRRLEPWWAKRPDWLGRVLFVAAFLAAVTGVAQLVNLHRRPPELLADARAAVPPGWVESYGLANKGSLLITISEGIVEASAPAPMSEADAVRDVTDHLAAKGCRVRVSPPLLATPTIEGRCDVAEINVRFSTAARAGQSDQPQIGSLRVHTTNAFNTQLFRSALAATAAFLVIVVPAIGLAARRPHA